MRKQLNLPVDAMIKVWIDTGDETARRAIEAHEDYIKTETRAVQLSLSKPPEDAYKVEWDIDGVKVVIGVEPAEQPT